MIPKKGPDAEIGMIEVIQVRNCQGVKTRYYRWISHEPLPLPGVYRVLLVMRDPDDSLFVRQDQLVEIE